MTIRTGANNHVEMVHRPGEAHLVKKLLTLLGFEPVVSAVPFAGTRWISSPDKILWVSEVTPEQWAFEQWLQAQLKESGTDESRSFHENLKRQPQKYAHFGLGLTSLADWQGVVARLKEAAANDPELKDRITLPLVVRPEDKGSVADDSAGICAGSPFRATCRSGWTAVPAARSSPSRKPCSTLRSRAGEGAAVLRDRGLRPLRLRSPAGPLRPSRRDRSRDSAGSRWPGPW